MAYILMASIGMDDCQSFMSTIPVMPLLDRLNLAAIPGRSAWIDEICASSATAGLTDPLWANSIMSAGHNYIGHDHMPPAT